MKRRPPYTAAHLSALRRPSVPIVAPIDGGIGLSGLECDQISALLTDYLAFSALHIAALDDAKCIAALELCERWRTQAADIRERIEGRE